MPPDADVCRYAGLAPSPGAVAGVWISSIELPGARAALQRVILVGHAGAVDDRPGRAAVHVAGHIRLLHPVVALPGRRAVDAEAKIIHLRGVTPAGPGMQVEAPAGVSQRIRAELHQLVTGEGVETS